MEKYGVKLNHLQEDGTRSGGVALYKTKEEARSKYDEMVSYYAGTDTVVSKEIITDDT